MIVNVMINMHYFTTYHKPPIPLGKGSPTQLLPSLEVIRLAR